jgi:hypothetical protein
VKISGLRWVTFEHTAWDLALATQSLAHLDGVVAYALSRVYSQQQSYADLTRGMTQAMYLIPRDENFDTFARRPTRTSATTPTSRRSCSACTTSCCRGSTGRSARARRGRRHDGMCGGRRLERRVDSRAHHSTQ